MALRGLHYQELAGGGRKGKVHHSAPEFPDNRLIAQEGLVMRKISLFKSYISGRAIWNVATLLVRSNWGAYIGEGPQVKAFEKEFGEKFRLRNVVALNSGTSALELAYELAGIKPGDEIITPVLTAPATNLPLLHREASIVFADIERDLNVSIDDVKKKITSRTKALVFVHFGGNNRGLKEMVELAREHELLLIEDAAQAIGSDYWGQGDFVCVSLQAIKTLTSGDGGFLIVKNDSLYDKARRLRWFGYDREKQQQTGDADIVEAGYKYHMSDITAAIGRGNLVNVDRRIAHRKALMFEYRQHGINANVWLATMVSDRRNELISFLKKRGVHAGIHHFRNDAYTVFGGRQVLPNMDELENSYLLLPLHHGVSLRQVKHICALVKNFQDRSMTNVPM
jgi:dTDP-4-amino-4,6-dideoxygalactose transaminase